MAKSRASVVESFRRTLAKPVELDVVLGKAGQRDRVNVEKHLALCDAEHGSPHGNLWRRLMRALATLAPLSIQTVGQQAIQFFIADGKYRMQVFALEDPRDGRVLLYTPDVLAEAQKLKLFDTDLLVEPLETANTDNPGSHFKNMLGWNRKALRITLPITATNGQIEAAENIAALAAKAWADKPQTQG